MTTEANGKLTFQGFIKSKTESLAKFGRTSKGVEGKVEVGGDQSDPENEMKTFWFSREAGASQDESWLPGLVGSVCRPNNKD